MSDNEELEQVKKMIQSEIDGWYDAMMQRYTGLLDGEKLNMMLNVGIGVMMLYIRQNIQLGYVQSVKDEIIQSIEKNLKLSIK